MPKAKPVTRKRPGVVRETLAPTRPAFATEAEERAWWETHDSVGEVDWSQATTVQLPNLRPSTVSISLRLPIGMLEELKTLANARDVPYQSLLKVLLAERLREEHQR